MALNRINQSVFDSSDNIVVDTLADILTLPKERYEGVLIVKGHTVVGDGGGGVFVYDSSVDRSTNNDGTIIDPTNTLAGTGCFIRLYFNSSISLSWFGADDSTTANLLEIYGIDGCTVFITDPVNGGQFKFDSGAVPSHDGVDNINGWVRINDSRFDKNIDMQGYRVTGASPAIANFDYVTLGQLTLLAQAENYIGVVPLFEPTQTATPGQTNFDTPATPAAAAQLLANESFGVYVDGQRYFPPEYNINPVTAQVELTTPLAGGEEVDIIWFSPRYAASIEGADVTATTSGITHPLNEWLGESGGDILVQAENTTATKSLSERFGEGIAFFDTKTAITSGYANYTDGMFIMVKGNAVIGDGFLGIYLVKTKTQADLDGDDYITPGTENILVSAASPQLVAVAQYTTTGSMPSLFDETKTLTSGQTVVVFSQDVSTATAYISGDDVDRGRLVKGVDYTVAGDNVTVTLTESYPINTTLTFSYWDPLGGIPDPGADNNVLQIVNTASDNAIINTGDKNIVHVTATDTGGANTACTITILTANITGGDLWTLTVKDAGGDAATNNITVVGQSGETINGAANYVLNTDNESVIIYNDGINMYTK